MKLQLVSKDETLDNELGIIIDDKFYSNNIDNNSEDFFEWSVREEENDIIITIVGESFESWEGDDEFEYGENVWEGYVEENKGDFLESISYIKEENFINPISVRYYIKK
jgi:UDP-2,3-diacylglucosamine pyrophosphatase LpxH